jgi:hypothetical protein
LHRHAGEVDADRATIEQLDEVVLPLGASISTAAVDLTDDDAA